MVGPGPGHQAHLRHQVRQGEAGLQTGAGAGEAGQAQPGEDQRQEEAQPHLTACLPRLPGG